MVQTDEERKAYRKEYYQKNKKQKIEYTKKYTIENYEKIKEYQKSYKPIKNKARREQNFKNRKFVIQHYSNKTNKCACCGEEEMYFLTIDHIEGRAKWGHEGYTSGKLYRFLIKNDYPKGFQVLCMNCNLAKGIYGKCPHEIMRKEESFARM